jgi:hypothetical protein
MKKMKKTKTDNALGTMQEAVRKYDEVREAMWEPTRYEFGSAPLKVEGGSYVPFPEKYTDVISDGGLDPRDRALDVQIGGGHYKDYAIQPVEFIHKNKIPYIEGCAIKYLCRWREKGGIEDLKKVKHYIHLLIEMEVEK